MLFERLCISPGLSFLLQYCFSGVRLSPAPTAPAWSLKRNPQGSQTGFGEKDLCGLGYATKGNGSTETSDPSSWLLSNEREIGIGSSSYSVK